MPAELTDKERLTLIGQLNVYMDGASIARYHVKRTTRRQSVGEHSGRVAMLVMLAAPGCSANVLKAALLHDISELATGDVPSPVKWANPVLGEELRRVTNEFEEQFGLRIPLVDSEADLLRWADLCEGVMFCYEELMLGNRNMINTFSRYVEATKKLLFSKPHPNAVVHARQMEITFELIERGERICNR